MGGLRDTLVRDETAANDMSASNCIGQPAIYHHANTPIDTLKTQTFLSETSFMYQNSFNFRIQSNSISFIVNILQYIDSLMNELITPYLTSKTKLNQALNTRLHNYAYFKINIIVECCRVTLYKSFIKIIISLNLFVRSKYFPLRVLGKSLPLPLFTCRHT